MTLIFDKPGVYSLEAVTRDQPGMLSAIAEGLFELGLNILRAQSIVSAHDRTVRFACVCVTETPVAAAVIRDRLASKVGSGLLHLEIEASADLTGSKAPPPRTYPPSQARFKSVFISYSHHDAELVGLLYGFLASRKVRCWLDEHELVPGVKLHSSIRDAIWNCDKVLLVCSASALSSWWVDRELEEVFVREREEGRLILIPINVDGAIFEQGYESDKATVIKARYIGNFREWRQDEAFNTAVRKLLAALREE